MKLTHENAYLFWGGPCSQWAKHPIVIDAVHYNCNEQYMMSQKAELFGHTEAHDAILKANDPSKHKAIGRKVKGYDAFFGSQFRRARFFS